MVSKFETDDDSITVTGPSFDYVKNQKYILKGDFIDHPKYGFQFQYSLVEKHIPSKKTEIIHFLSSDLFKGVGKKTATKIYDLLGDEAITKIKNDFSILEEIGIKGNTCKNIIDGFIRMDEGDNNAIFTLISNGYSNKEARLIYRYYKEDTLTVLYSNPFLFYLNAYGIPFKKVLENSRNLNIENLENYFKEAYIVYLFKEKSFETGDLYLKTDEFRNKYDKEYDDFDEYLSLCLEHEYLYNDNGDIYLTNEYHDEFYIANYLNTNKETLILDDKTLDLAINDIQLKESITFDDTQIEAIKSFFKESMSLIIGGPGTGKTTIIKAIVSIYNEYFFSNTLMVLAPTGRAAKRVSEMNDVPSKTIHSLLKWDKETNSFSFNEDNPILFDTLIIDEFSMVDNGLFAALLKASTYVKKICLIGDANQLPSIRQGNLLEDLIDSNKFKVTNLKYNHRQKNGNDIISLANGIIEDNIDFDSYNKDDVRFVDINTVDKMMIIKSISSMLNNGLELNDIQLLSPMYRGEYGIDSLNLLMQEAFNPIIINDNKHIRGLYRLNDKVLQLKNRPSDDVYNGDIGKLVEIDNDSNNLIVNYQDTLVYYPFDDLSDLTLAYTLSVHKSQGSEYNTVFLIISKQHRHMLSKKLIYTAITRCKKHLIIIGDKDSFIKGIHTENLRRKTKLVDRLNML